MRVNFDAYHPHGFSSTLISEHSTTKKERERKKNLPLSFLFSVFTLTSLSEHIDLENLSGMAALARAGKLGAFTRTWPKFESAGESLP